MRTLNTLQLNEHLFSWEEIREKYPWTGILVGNGASRAIWEGFHYKSLYEKASSSTLENPLSAANKQIFESLGTQNFERVLSILSDAELVCKILQQDTCEIRRNYENIQRALVEAIKHVHIPWTEVPNAVLQTVRSGLRCYRFVYSANYDLLLYWAVMAKDDSGFKDYFWSEGRFNISDTEIWDEATAILFLHGGLHLYRLRSGEIVKRKAEPTSNLLDLFGTPYLEETTPLFVSEGKAKDKLASIDRSSYLSFAFSQFSKHSGPLVIFGHSLGESDSHLGDAMRKWDNPTLAISVRETAGKIISRKFDLHKLFPRANLIFFDARTHPLGNFAVQGPENGKTCSPARRQSN